MSGSGGFGFVFRTSLPGGPAGKSSPFLQPAPGRSKGAKSPKLNTGDLAQKLPRFAFLANAKSTIESVKRHPDYSTPSASEGLTGKARDTVYPPFVASKTSSAPSPTAPTTRILQFYGENGPFPNSGPATSKSYPPFVNERPSAPVPAKAKVAKRSKKARAAEPSTPVESAKAAPAARLRASAFPPFVGSQGAESS
jgi:hypothetical protein